MRSGCSGVLERGTELGCSRFIQRVFANPNPMYFRERQLICVPVALGEAP